MNYYIAGFFFRNFELPYYIGMFYYVLGNIRAELRSTHRVVQLLVCIECPTLGKYGFEEVLQPFIKDVNTLCDVSTCIALSHMYMYMCNNNYIKFFS